VFQTCQFFQYAPDKVCYRDFTSWALDKAGQKGIFSPLQLGLARNSRLSFGTFKFQLYPVASCAYGNQCPLQALQSSSINQNFPICEY
jgi:hypothetical protein